ncbi:MAG: 2-dehydropantoate 2-reductase [Ktedonobacterales bacterium]|jgi:2-dehydropantoate 2-reductase|nr:MAG: 2-dehydropantoate 2-reductase [Ktedonobacterales bacterium]
MRIAVVGSGGLGGYFGALLARAGEDVSFLARGAQLAAIRASGLTVQSRLSGDFTLPVRVTDEAREIGPVDLALFTVKSYGLEAAAEQCRPLVGAETTVLPLLNGIDATERLGATFGSERVLGGVALVTAAVAAPGVIAQTGGPGMLMLGELAGGISPRVEQIAARLQRAGIPASAEANIMGALWNKFVLICAFSGLTALTRLPIGPILSTPETRELYTGIMREVEAVARAHGVALPDEVIERTLALSSGMGASERGSMAHDLLNGRRMELETLNGTVVRLGRAHGIPTPLNFAIYAALKPYEQGTSG